MLSETEKLISQKIKRRRTFKKYFFIYGMLSVAIVHFCVFYVYMNIESFLLAFKDPNDGSFTLSNFDLFFNDLKLGANSNILLNLKNTLIYYFTGLASIVLSFLSSYFIYKKVLLYKLFRFTFMMPMIISSVVYVAIYSAWFGVGGIVGKIWSAISKDTAPFFLRDERYATNTIVVFQIWTGLGMNIILFSGAMSRIPDSIIEYGRLEGVREMREMWSIVLPLIAPTFGTVLLLSCVGIFSASGPILLFTNGMYKTSTIGYWMYETIFLNEQYNYGAAFGLMLTIASLPIVFVVQYINKRMPEVEF